MRKATDYNIIIKQDQNFRIRYSVEQDEYYLEFLGDEGLEWQKKTTIFKGYQPDSNVGGKVKK